MHDLDLSFGAQFPAWVLLLAAAALVGTALVFYVGVRRALKPGSLAVLIALRVLAAMTLLVLFFDPVLSYERESSVRSDVAIVLDTSKSMSVRDFPSRPDRLDLAKNELLGDAGLVARLSRRFNVKLYRFDAACEPVAPNAAASLAPTGEATGVARAVQTVLERHDASNLAGIVVVTDGNDNVSPDLARDLENVRTRLFLVGVGTRSREGLNYKDVLVTDVRTRPDRFLTVNNKALVDVTLKSVGYPPVERTVVLSERGGAELGRATVVLESKDEPLKATLEVLPTKVGKFTWEASVAPDAEERFGDNNRQTVTVHVVDPKIRVLYVDKPRDEYKQLLRTLERDPNASLLTLVNNRVGAFTQGGNISDVQFVGFPQSKEQLASFDVILMGSVKRAYFSAEQLDAIREFVRDGKGFAMLGGTESFGAGGFGGTAIDDILPVECGAEDTGQERDMFPPRLTAEGKVHPIFAGCERFFAAGGSGAGTLDLQGFNRVARIMPGAAVLADNPARGNAPIVVVRNYGKGRTAAFTSTGTYRWYRLTAPLGEDSPYVRFWGQLVRWLAGREAKERAVGPGLAVTLDKDRYEPGEKVRVSASVRDRDGLATDKAEVTGVMAGNVGQLARVKLSWDAATGSYVDEFEPPGPGEYKAHFEATLAKESLGAADDSFAVGKPSLESEKVDLNETLLQRVADRDRKNRLYCTLVGSGVVDERLRDAVRLFVEPKQFKLGGRGSALLLLLFVALLSFEWTLRKRWQLL